MLEYVHTHALAIFGYMQYNIVCMKHFMPGKWEILKKILPGMGEVLKETGLHLSGGTATSGQNNIPLGIGKFVFLKEMQAFTCSCLDR